MDTNQLFQRWRATLAGITEPPAIETGFHNLSAHYAEKQRHYHTLEHIAQCLKQLDAVTELAQDKLALELALWFHDVIYLPGKNNNEKKSADYAIAFLQHSSLTPQTIATIASHIRLTRHPSEPVTVDEKLLIDIDLSILGCPPDLYNTYEKQIRQEYSHVPAFLYKRGRKKILNFFLRQTPLFKTDFFNSRLGDQAKINLKNAITALNTVS